MTGISKRKGYWRTSGKGKNFRRSLVSRSELEAKWGMSALSEILDGLSRSNCVPEFSEAQREQGDLEMRLLKFQSAAHALLKWHMRRNARQLDLALAAYDVGLAEGFYGSESAITGGLLIKLKLLAEEWAKRRGWCVNWALLDQVIIFGNCHGEGIKSWRRDVGKAAVV
ncbi:hypothetical protein [Burkholderia ubonensis]|uniref:hypothetical protein n=1 Tax=Burkholderia ubonensis TaxID=101571 RepID=UPI0012F8D3F5|nr:hypothetical protein [Burkholderia ubonensis]